MEWRTDLQRRLVKDGYRGPHLHPFGKDWFPYFSAASDAPPTLASRPQFLPFLTCSSATISGKR